MDTQRVILVGGCCLAFGAAFANTGVFLHTGTSVSHLTGDISRLSIDLLRASPTLIADILMVSLAALSFLFGAILAGFLIHHPTLDFARPYGRTITGIGILFVVSSQLLLRLPLVAISLTAFGCGLQNSLATKYNGVILRTTHLTGLVTDFGVTLGMILKRFDIPLWKLLVPGVLILSFFMGGISSAMAFLVFNYDPTFIAGIAYILAGVGWTIFKHGILKRRYHPKIHESGK